MEQYRAELRQKSHYVKSLDTSMFFSWDVFHNSKQYGITIDANALSDVTRSRDEVAKLAYLCFIKYAELSKKLGLLVKNAPEFDLVSVWVSMNPDEFAQAAMYITQQFLEKSEQGKKKSSPQKIGANSKSHTRLQSMRTKLKRFWPIRAKKAISSEN